MQGVKELSDKVDELERRLAVIEKKLEKPNLTEWKARGMFPPNFGDIVPMTKGGHMGRLSFTNSLNL